MAQNVDPVFLRTPINVGVTITAADTTTLQDAYTANADGGAVITMNATSADAADATLVLWFNDGTTDYRLGEVVVTAGAGTDGTTPAKNLLDSAAMPGAFDADGSFIVSANAKLRVSAKATVGGDIEIAGSAGHYS